MPWINRHPLLMWSLAWGVTGTSLAIADVFSTPRHGPFWVAVAGGMVSWSVAGGATVGVLAQDPSSRRVRIGAFVWGGAYLLALGLGALSADWAEENLASAGFVGALIAWSAAAATAACATTWLIRDAPGVVRPIKMALGWGFGFFAAGYLAIVLSILMGQAARGLLHEVLGQYPAFIVGWGVACSLAGAAAGALGLSIGHVVSRSAAA